MRAHHEKSQNIHIQIVQGYEYYDTALLSHSHQEYLFFDEAIIH